MRREDFDSGIGLSRKNALGIMNATIAARQDILQQDALQGNQTNTTGHTTQQKATYEEEQQQEQWGKETPQE
jgi:hypothetical protein